MGNKLDDDYLRLLADILQNGFIKENRTEIQTKSLFGRTITHNMNDGFPLLTSKKIEIRSVIYELLWFLNGDTNVRYLLDNNVNIWNGDVWKNYQNKNKNISNILTKEDFINKIKSDEAFCKVWGELGPIYGKQWRKWSSQSVERNEDGKINEYNFSTIDQISNLLKDLKENPDSRRLMVSAWAVDSIDKMILPPCHYSFQCYTRELSKIERYKIWFPNNYETGFEYNEENIPDFDNAYWIPTPERELSLSVSVRSNDIFLGQPFNIASYGFLLTMIAQQVNMFPGKLILNIGDAHLYLNHINQANKQINNTTYTLPQLKLKKAKDLFSYSYEDFEILNYRHSGPIKAPLNN